MAASAAWNYIEYISSEKESKTVAMYKKEAFYMQKKVSSMILAKQKATMAVALSIINDTKLAQNLSDNTISQNYYENLIKQYKEHTLYKNIWLNIIDRNFVSRYRSWTPKKGDNIYSWREELVNMFLTKKPIYSIGRGKFDLAIRVVVPILKDGEVLGVLELISHFNSISKEMQKSNISSAVVLDKKYKDELIYPFSKTFIDDYYIANLDLKPEILKHLNECGIEKHCRSGYLIDGDYLVTSYKLKSLNNELLGHYIMFKKLENILTPDLDFWILKWVFLGVFIIMALAGIVNIILFYLMREQKVYYKNIMDSSTNIVVVNRNSQIIEVNKMFFNYFSKYLTLEEFKKKHECICDFFIKQDGYLQKEMHGVSWIDYMIKNPILKYKVKMNLGNNIYYFAVTASEVDEEKSYYSAVFTDITKEENYKHELEHLSTTDSLTGIKNRHYFEDTMSKEINRADRYNEIFSLIMFDIDYFKKVNDTYGHDEGDRVLVKYTQIVDSMIRESDIFCRIGGEEFMIILPKTVLESATQIAEKLRVTVEKHSQILPITISLGVVEYKINESFDQHLKRVDNALYEAKNSGRNRVVVG